MRIMGLPGGAILAATIVFFIWGGLWYGLFFDQLWMAGNGVSEPDFEGQSQMWMLGGVAISLISVIGMAKVLKWRGWPDIGGAIGTALVLGICFGSAVWAYNLVYLPAHDMSLFLVNIGHLILGWVVAAIVLTLVR